MSATLTPSAISLFQLMEQFTDEAAATAFFEARRWTTGTYCPHCGSFSVSAIASCKPMPYRCRDCRQHFSVRTGTVLAESKVSLRKWILAIYLIHSARKGVSSVQMAKEVGVTQKTAWFLNHRIREAMQSRGGLFSGEVEVDETYIGGKQKNRHMSKRESIGRGAVGKQAVLGIRQRDGQTKAFPIIETDGITLKCAIVENVKRGTTVYTDSHAGYVGIAGYAHHAVCHSVGEYVRGQAHTNGIESFWSLLKRGYIGIYHYMSTDHLHRYVTEFSSRHNTREVDTIACIGLTIDGMIGRRLTYKGLIR